MGEEIVGLVRGCVKTVTCGKRLARNSKLTTGGATTTTKHVPVYTKVGYILGLRVAPSHRYCLCHRLEIIFLFAIYLTHYRNLHDYVPTNGPSTAPIVEFFFFLAIVALMRL